MKTIKAAKKSKFAAGLLALCLGAGLLAGCGQSAASLDKSAFLYDMSAITVPDTVRLVALGEASHGASELQQMKADVFQALVANGDCRVFAIEGDFGGCAKVDEYIHGGAGTAQEAVGQIGFRIYRTQELADLVEWMRDYNQTAPVGQDLHFAGFDMQRYDNNKAYLLQYLADAAPELEASYREKFETLTDETMYDLPQETLSAAQRDLETLMQEMEQTLPVAQQDEAFAFARQCAQSMLENTQLRQSTSQYNALRDAAMKNKVDWLCERYDGQIFLNGHNGHIAKVSAVGYDCMGAQLAQSYGDAYFAIGTDVATCRFNGQTGDGYQEFTVENKNALTSQLAGAPGNAYYLDFAAVAADPAWQAVLGSTQKMMALNVTFDAWQKWISATHTLRVVPQDSYNAVIVLNSTTPTHLL